ncbi:NADH dehydrogenase [ubiquinone] iron-sulfur protein 5-like [Ptychodera flava]|uniref:NADH dehydrogenase [ubiquinone] iron-sulfur protein 5-like n=1 Tax=Ptychodera flava TaxID=63121 RepID=UPI00396A0B41
MPLFTIPKWEWDKPLTGHNIREKFFMQNGHPLSKCADFELDFLHCADGLGRKRALQECNQEWEDFIECGNNMKKSARRAAIREQRDKLVKEGKWPPK